MSYLSQGADSTSYIGPTYPSKDFVRLLQKQRDAAYAQWGPIDPLEVKGTQKGKPFVSPTYANAIIDVFKYELAAGRREHGLQAFPNVDGWLTVMRGLVEKDRFWPVMGPYDSAAFWTYASKCAIDLGSMAYSVTFVEGALAFLEGAREGLNAIARSTSDLIGKPLFDLAQLVKWSVIGGAGLAVWWYGVRPYMAARGRK